MPEKINYKKVEKTPKVKRIKEDKHQDTEHEERKSFAEYLREATGEGVKLAEKQEFKEIPKISEKSEDKVLDIEI